MSGFSNDWLRLREPYDAQARSDEFVRRLRSQLPMRPLRAMDLGAGTASNIRYLAPRLTGEQLWFAIDDDVALLAAQPRELRGVDFQCTVMPQQADLAAVSTCLATAGCHLVTASALLDLVSAAWLSRLAAQCAAERATVLFALSYDGRIECSPSDVDDDWLNALVNRHQQTDKGFGPALGANATAHACQAFAALDYTTYTEASDWLLEPDDLDLQRELLDGWIGAASGIAEDKARVIEWGRRRRAHLLARRSRIRVGHQDFMAWPKRSGE